MIPFTIFFGIAYIVSLLSIALRLKIFSTLRNAYSSTQQSALSLTERFPT